MFVGAIALVAAACGGTEAVEDSAAAPAATTATNGTTAPETSTDAVTTTVVVDDEAASSSEVPAESVRPLPADAPPAPDFTLALDDGSEFVLSAEQKPVYMVFWAEW
jgi:hypothetical protein